MVDVSAKLSSLHVWGECVASRISGRRYANDEMWMKQMNGGVVINYWLIYWKCKLLLTPKVGIAKFLQDSTENGWSKAKAFEKYLNGEGTEETSKAEYLKRGGALRCVREEWIASWDS